MPKMRVSMRKIREVLRLTHELGLSVRQVREATGVGKTAVSEYVSRAKVIGITWPIPPEIDDAELERRLFTPAGFHDGPTRTAPDWAKVGSDGFQQLTPRKTRTQGRKLPTPHPAPQRRDLRARRDGAAPLPSCNILSTVGIIRIWAARSPRSYCDDSQCIRNETGSG